MNAPSGGPGTAATQARTDAPAPVPSGPVPSAKRPEPLYGGRTSRRVTVNDLAAAKARGEKWPMLTAYDALVARVFDDAGIPVLLVGDSAGMVVFGHDTTIPVTVDDLIPLTAAVVRGTSRALIVADLPFGSYQSSPEAALATGIRFLKETGAHAVKLEGGHRVLRQAEELVAAGIPVMAHLGLTPAVGQRVRRVPGAGPRRGRRTATARRQAMEVAGRVRRGARVRARGTRRQGHRGRLSIPTIGIGAGPDCDAQVLVWQDMAGLSPRTPKFVKRYADVAGVLGQAAQAFAEDVVGGACPGHRALLPLTSPELG